MACFSRKEFSQVLNALRFYTFLKNPPSSDILQELNALLSGGLSLSAEKTGARLHGAYHLVYLSTEVMSLGYNLRTRCQINPGSLFSLTRISSVASVWSWGSAEKLFIQTESS